MSSHSSQQKHAFFVKTKENSKSQKQILKNKVSLGLFHQRLGHRSTRSLLDGDTENIWQNIEITVDPKYFCTSCQIFTTNKKSGSEAPMKPNTPFEWVFMDIIPAISSKILTKDTTFSNYHLILGAYYKIPKLYGMENITTGEVMYKLDMFQARFGKVNGLCWWYMERNKTGAGK